jgi:hypothetical protein
MVATRLRGDGISAQIFLQLDRADGVYRPGEALRGACVIVTRAALRTRAVTLHIIGDEITTLGPNVLMTEHTHPYQLAYPLWSASIEQDQLPAGEHTFTFTTALPPGLPPTFNGELTKIAYRIEVKIDRALLPDLRAERPVTIRVPLLIDLDKPVRASASLRDGLTLELALAAGGCYPGDHVTGTLQLIGRPAAEITAVTVEIASREKGQAREFADHVEHVRVRAEIDPAQLAGGQPYPIDLPLPDDADPSFVAQHSAKSRYVRARVTLADGRALLAETVIRVGQR